MNFDQLRYFTNIAETLNYSRSSQILNVTQPALSLSVARMEEEIGFPLFVKKGRNIELSPYGERFYGYSVTILNNYKNALREMAALEQETEQAIALALNICFNYDYINSFIAAFHERYPSRHIDTMLLDASDIEPGLASGKLPFAISHNLPTLQERSDIEAIQIATYPLFVFISENNPLSKEEVITPEQLSTCIMLANTFPFKQSVLENKNSIYKPKSILVVPDFEAMKQTVAADTGVMVGNFALTEDMKAMGIRRIPYSNYTCPYLLYRNTNRLMTGAEKQFKDFVVSYIKKHPFDPTTV